MVALSHILMRSRMGTDRVLRAWLVAWLGGSVLGVINGVAREVLYKDRVGDQAANYISTGTLLALLAFYLWLLQRRWPIRSRGTAYGIGTSWVVLTIMFEFGFGHYVDGKSWGNLLHNYNVADGEIWVLVLLWMAVAPAALRRLSGSEPS